MKLGNTPRQVRLLLATLGLCCLLGPIRPARADEPKPAAPGPATLPRIFDGDAGFVRLSAYTMALESTMLGVFWAFRSRDEAAHAANLAAPLSGAQGIGACRKPLAVNVRACNDLAFSLGERDKDGDYSVGFFVVGGVMAAAATASIWLWRTPGRSYWIPDWWKVTPTVGPKSGGVILHGSW